MSKTPTNLIIHLKKRVNNHLNPIHISQAADFSNKKHTYMIDVQKKKKKEREKQ